MYRRCNRYWELSDHSLLWTRSNPFEACVRVYVQRFNPFETCLRVYMQRFTGGFLPAVHDAASMMEAGLGGEKNGAEAVK